MKRCCKYNANQRPLIDTVRHDLQDLREGAAQIDRAKTRSRMSFEMIGNDTDEETKSSSPMSSADPTSGGTYSDVSLQGSGTNSIASSVEIEMEVI